ncbi:MAG TPA: pilus assembly protein PilP [Candidatus Binatia bacterium]|nr:pilus assembly protein PilP [Candidatus Binatia bacterium]
MSRRLAVATTVAALLAGCSGDMNDLEQYAAEVKGRKSRAIDPIPQPKPYEPFSYAPGDRRDPFLAVLQSREDLSGAAGAIRPDTNRPKEPLEEFSLDALRMVGTIVQKGHAYALLKAPDGVVHRVSIGDHMGQNFGKVTDISETEITLTEIIPDGLGGWMQRPATIALAQP